jgi:hypothetical protein
MCRMSSTDKPDLFAHPDPRDFDYKPLLIALRECRQRVTEFMSATGVRNPAYIEAESLVAYIDAVARLTRIEGAGRFVAREVDEIRF